MTGEGMTAPIGKPKVYATAAASVSDAQASVVALWREGFAHFHMPEAKFDWFYRRNPQGTPLVMFLRHGDHAQPVGVAAAGPRRMRLGDEIVTAGQMVDFVVLAQHRTFFPAISLQRELTRCALRSYGLLYGMPNPNSLAVFRRIGYKPVCEMVRRVRVLRAAAYLSRILPAWLANTLGPVVDQLRLGIVELRNKASGDFSMAWRDRPDARFDDLWARCAIPGVLMGTRDNAFLTWRFVDCHPRRTHRFFTLHSAGDDRPVAYAACEAVEQALHVRDFLVDPAVPAAWPRLWLALVGEAFRQGYATLSVDFGGSEEVHRRHEALGFRVRERRPVYASAPAPWAERFRDCSCYFTDADEDD